MTEQPSDVLAAHWLAVRARATSLRMVPLFETRAALEQELVGSAKMQSTFAAIRLWHGPLTAAYAAQAIVGLVVAAAVAGMLVMWSIGHQWYAIALAVTAVPCCWLGGLLAARGAKAVAA